MTSNPPVKFLGVTPPITTDPPKPNDIKSSEALMADLVALNQFESDQERKVRERLLSNIAQLVAKFVHDVSIKLGMSEKIASEAGGRIYTSGSYRLGVHGPGSDIDTICVCPRHIYREHFFGEFQDMLRAWPAVTEISAVESAFVPVMKTVISGVEVDLLFARVNLPEAGDLLDIEKDEILRGVDDASQRSPRVTDMILNLVPDVATFRTALRTIRLWAKRRGIYSNVLGFPGGVAWALLTARICQLYPAAAPATIVGKFFPIYYQWNWPQPVLLKKIDNGPPNMQHSVWNPKVVASASTSDGIKDCGMVESRIRTLVGDLENTDCIITAHPQVGGVNRVFYCLTEEEQAAASQGELTAEMIDRTEEEVEGKEHRKIYTKSFFIGLEIEKKSKETGGRVLNLFYPSKKFCASKKKTKRQQQNGSEDAGMNDGSEGQGPSKRTKSEQTSFNNSEPQQQLPNGIPVPNGADPVPLKDGTGPVDFKPPPGIEDMPPLSTAAMSSFATAAKGVANSQDENKEGLVVVNQSAPASS
ncbi:hypothetical protein I312_101171 [Cryptococcus bacillisporus CA1280]|uniref:uncharacterized protein n=1 Tax=Cryptococcus bacillisporus CA1280 TaxID=1296109 RepID=UPI0033694C38